MRVRADRSAELANRNLFTRRTKPLVGPTKFVVHERHFQSKRNRLGMNTMAPADHWRLLVRMSFLCDHFTQFCDICQKDVA
jgi:hypothetical protein